MTLYGLMTKVWRMRNRNRLALNLENADEIIQSVKNVSVLLKRLQTVLSLLDYFHLMMSYFLLEIGASFLH